MATTKVIIHPLNWTKGRAYPISGIVIHIMQGSLLGTDDWFQRSPTMVPPVFASAHDGIGKNGDVHEYVEAKDTAYHAGRVSFPTWTGMKKDQFGNYINPNGYTYGIENEGRSGELWTEAQMVSLCARVKLILDANNLSCNRKTIISHSEVTSDKEDMTLWCDEIVKRLTPFQAVDKLKIIKEIEDRLEILKKP